MAMRSVQQRALLLSKSSPSSLPALSPLSSSPCHPGWFGFSTRRRSQRCFSSSSSSGQEDLTDLKEREMYEYKRGGLLVKQLKAFKDNYIYLVREETSGEVFCVDPGDPAPVLEALEKLDWGLNWILSTHHHNDHVGGNLELKAKTGCGVVTAEGTRARIPGCDEALRPMEMFGFGLGRNQNPFLTLDIPGHTRDHTSFLFGGSDCIFVGDTLFALGCGRLFEGSPAQMFNSLSALATLPDHLTVFCAHEYTEANAAFALKVEPGNHALQERVKQISNLREKGLPTVPSTIGQEKSTNPFLRASSPEIRANLGFNADAPDVDVFAKLREMKDTF